MICASGALRGGGLTVSRGRPVGTIDAVDSPCLESRVHPQKVGVRRVAQCGLRTRRPRPGRKHPSRWRPRAAAAGLRSSARLPFHGQGAGGRSSGVGGARACTAWRPLSMSYGHAREQKIARHRALELRSLAFLRARAHRPGAGPTPFAEPLGSRHSSRPDADHGRARATLAHWEMGTSHA